MKEKLNKLKQIMRKFIKKPYYYVRPCPFCESRMTGRFFRYNRETETEWVINEGLRNGELLSPLPEITTYNCFCTECDAVWYESIPMSFFSLEQIQEEKVARGTNEILGQRIKEMREYEKKHKKNILIRFIGKV